MNLFSLLVTLPTVRTETELEGKNRFITTPTSIAYAAQLRDSKIILIDGQKLTKFMIEHDVGVSIKETFHLKRLDEDFFADVDF